MSNAQGQFQRLPASSYPPGGEVLAPPRYGTLLSVRVRRSVMETNWSSFFILAMFPMGLAVVILANMYVDWYEEQIERKEREK